MRRRLPNDFSRCVNELCPRKRDCLRWVQNKYDYGTVVVSVFDFHNCSNFIKAHKDFPKVS